tara:strand:- start:583 stop:1380 length:798 start_codon:yes stop_codon:yes gene_type:complete
VAIQYSISYDDKGNPSLVKNTIEGSRPVVKTSFNIGEYKPVRTIQTDFDFDNITEQNAETVYQSLQKYIYQTETNSDDSPKQQSEQDKFLKQSFEAAAARDDEGKVIGGSTFKEKIKMAAVDTYIDSKLNPIKSTIIGQIPVVGTIHKALTHAGSQYVDPYYDPVDDYYYSTGFGMYDESRKAQAARDDRLTSSGGVKIDNAYTYGSDYQGSDTPSKVVEQMNQAAAKAAMTSNAAYTGGGADRDQEDRSPGSTGRGGSDEMGSF